MVGGFGKEILNGVWAAVTLEHDTSPRICVGYWVNPLIPYWSFPSRIWVCNFFSWVNAANVSCRLFKRSSTKVAVILPSSTGRLLWVLYPDPLSVAIFTFDLFTTFESVLYQSFKSFFLFRVMLKDASLPFLDRSFLVDINSLSEI